MENDHDKPDFRSLSIYSSESDNIHVTGWHRETCLDKSVAVSLKVTRNKHGFLLPEKEILREKNLDLGRTRGKGMADGCFATTTHSFC